MTQKLLFVCLGNICRSPAAEGVFLHLLEERGLSDQFVVDSAGTGGWHVGNPADRRMQAAANRRGINLPSRARQISLDYVSSFDLVLTMDDDNLAAVQGLAREAGPEQRPASSPCSATPAGSLKRKCRIPITGARQASSMCSTCSRMPAPTCSRSSARRRRPGFFSHPRPELPHQGIDHSLDAHAIGHELNGIVRLHQRSLLTGAVEVIPFGDLCFEL